MSFSSIFCFCSNKLIVIPLIYLSQCPEIPQLYWEPRDLLQYMYMYLAYAVKLVSDAAVYGHLLHIAGFCCSEISILASDCFDVCSIVVTSQWAQKCYRRKLFCVMLPASASMIGEFTLEMLVLKYCWENCMMHIISSVIIFSVSRQPQ